MIRQNTMTRQARRDPSEPTWLSVFVESWRVAWPWFAGILWMVIACGAIYAGFYAATLGVVKALRDSGAIPGG